MAPRELGDVAEAAGAVEIEEPGVAARERGLVDAAGAPFGMAGGDVIEVVSDGRRDDALARSQAGWRSADRERHRARAGDARDIVFEAAVLATTTVLAMTAGKSKKWSLASRLLP